MTAPTKTAPEVSASIRFTGATFVLPGVAPAAFCQWAAENFGVTVKHQGGDAYWVSPRFSGDDVWGALKDIHAHRDWVKTPEGQRALEYSATRATRS